MIVVDRGYYPFWTWRKSRRGLLGVAASGGEVGRTIGVRAFWRYDV